MANPAQRDDIHGTAASASAESFRDRRQGDLTRASDGFRAPTLPEQPRRPVQQGYTPDPGVTPYHYNPASPPGAPFPDVPRNFAFLRAPDLGAPHVGFPDRERTEGKLQPSGRAWGGLGKDERPRLAPPIQSQPPGTENTDARDSVKSAQGPRWQWPSDPRIYTR